LPEIARDFPCEFPTSPSQKINGYKTLGQDLADFSFKHPQPTQPSSLDYLLAINHRQFGFSFWPIAFSTCHRFNGLQLDRAVCMFLYLFKGANKKKPEKNRKH